MSVQTVLWGETKHPCGAWLPRPAWLLPWQPAAYQHRPFHGVSEENWQRPQELEFPKAGPPADSLQGILGDMGQCPGKQVLIQWPGVGYYYPFFLG